MARFFSLSIIIWPLVISCFSLQLERVVGFPKIFHRKRVSFLVVGDWGRGGEFNQSKVATQMGYIGKQLSIDFVISTGDNFYDDGLKDVNDPSFRRSFSNIYTSRSLRKPWYAVLGNHDYQGNVEAQLSPSLKRKDKRWNCQRNFIVRKGYADIFFVDTTPFVKKYFDNPKDQTFDWRNVLPRERYVSSTLENLNLSLEKSRAPWKIVVAHHTIRSIGYHGDTQEIVDKLLPILEAHKVDIYMNGHDHCLQHLSNDDGSMQFLTSGGGSKAWKNIIHYGMHKDTTHFYHDGQGFVSVEITRDKANVVFYEFYGRSIHGFKLEKGRKMELHTSKG